VRGPLVGGEREGLPEVVTAQRGDRVETRAARRCVLLSWRLESGGFVYALLGGLAKTNQPKLSCNGIVLFVVTSCLWW
jgi:hypothetical protein